MLRIGSRASGVDLIAQTQLNRSFSELSAVSERLSTLKRINRGSDDPAGLIALEQLRAEFVSLDKAIESAERTRGLIRAADSGLSQASNILNDIRGALLESVGATASPAQRQALQLVVDAGLEGLDRLGATVQLGGRRLLDGSGGFQASGANPAQIVQVDISKSAGSGLAALDVDVQQAAQAAEVTIEAPAPTQDSTLTVRGDLGTAAVNIAANSTSEQLAAAISAVSAATGVTAETVDGDVILSSVAVGSGAEVRVEVVSGDIVAPSDTAKGTDAVVTVNGVAASADGNVVSFRSETVSAEIVLAEGFEGQADPITVEGEGLQVLVGPNPNDTAAFSLPQVNSAVLGGAAGRLTELRSGGAANVLDGDPQLAAAILDAAQSQIVSSRAGVGAFEKFTIDSTTSVLEAALINVSQASSQIGDADVAVESARLVRALILAESSVTSVKFTNLNRRLGASLLDDLFDRI